MARNRGFHGSLANRSRPAGCSVLASNVRISVTPLRSSVTTTRSPETPVAITLAPFGSIATASTWTGSAVAALVDAIADHGDDHRNAEQGRDAGNHRHPPHLVDHRLRGRVERLAVGVFQVFGGGHDAKARLRPLGLSHRFLLHKATDRGRRPAMGARPQLVGEGRVRGRLPLLTRKRRDPSAARKSTLADPS